MPKFDSDCNNAERQQIMKKKIVWGSGRAALLLAALLLILPGGGLTAGAAEPVLVESVLPGGDAFGVELRTKGVLVVGTDPVDCPGEDVSPAKEAGIRVGDILTHIGGNEISGVPAVLSAVSESGGKPVEITLLRAGKSKSVRLTPVKSEGDQSWKAGVWLRDRTAGIGTVTYYLPQTGGFSGLGHGICDSDTGILMPLSGGTVRDVQISGIRRGQKGAPGELRGYFAGGKTGALTGNTKCGVYGVLTDLSVTDGRTPVRVARPGEIHEGDVTIRCTLGSSGVGEYSAKILRLCGDEPGGKNFVLEITDPVLLEKTGGIVQGMSGSPILQEGALVGAVTHVLLDDPTKGYGILIENVLAKMPDLIG